MLTTIAAVLGTDALVMWGANLQVGTPNEAALRHTDLESRLWPKGPWSSGWPAASR